MIRRFNHFELKYLLSLKQAESVKNTLKAYLLPDEHGNSCGRYTLASLYFDSPDLCCYWEKVGGIKFRRKLRIRHYESGEPLSFNSPVFVEIKQRIDRVTQKRRAVLPYTEAMRFCLTREMSDHSQEDRAVIEEVFTFLWQYNLHAASIVRYDRQAFVGTDFDIGLRVTFDTNLTSQTNPLRLDEPPSTLSMFPANIAVMEIKVNERIPYWLTELVANHNLQIARISKYCRSMETTDLILTKPTLDIASVFASKKDRLPVSY